MNKNGNTKPAAAPTAESMLKITKEQEWAASLRRRKDREEIAAAVGVSRDIIEDWEEHPRYLAEIAQIDLEINADAEVKQAAALVLGNFSYADAEAALDLEEGTIIKWAQDAGSAFNSLLVQMKFLANPPTPSDDKYDDLEGLSDEQIQAIPLILEGKTDVEVGDAIGRTRETVNRWRNHDEDFADALEDARDSFMESQRVAVSAGAQMAVSALEELLDSEDDKVRLQAASLLLKTAPALKK